MNSRGNAFVYILIAVVLFGALTFSLSGSQEETSIGELNEGKTKVAANSILAYATAAQNSIVTLDRLGVGADSINFILPSDAAFNTAPSTAKLFHPEGGGLTYKPLPNDAIDKAVTGTPRAAFYIGRFSNVLWTPTTAQDVLFTAYGITRDVCAAINVQVTGSATIPTATDLEDVFVDVTHHSGSNLALNLTTCAACDEIPALCTTDGTRYAFYSIMVPR